ncbi:hypothetical protein ACFWOB_44805 [Streptomyces sp. NPDC058420]|uniref:hypothetical protein n=1 Tax=Streptomyces sp. NPDC058420 TaxID=3346489 RepID=UPI003650FF4B
MAVFQRGHAASLLGVDQSGPIMSLKPILLVGVVFGLARNVLMPDRRGPPSPAAHSAVGFLVLDQRPHRNLT